MGQRQSNTLTYHFRRHGLKGSRKGQAYKVSAHNHWFYIDLADQKSKALLETFFAKPDSLLYIHGMESREVKDANLSTEIPHFYTKPSICFASSILPSEATWGYQNTSVCLDKLGQGEEYEIVE